MASNPNSDKVLFHNVYAILRDGSRELSARYLSRGEAEDALALMDYYGKAGYLREDVAGFEHVEEYESFEQVINDPKTHPVGQR